MLPASKAGKKLALRCQSMPISAHAAVLNEKAHQAKALMGFVILVFAKPAPMASWGQCTPGFFKFCKVQGLFRVATLSACPTLAMLRQNS
ncbi:hypothetical protein JAK23_15665 [Stenotrophomonas maltophilia]|uniref:hypothetical protein n=1 Tax=Stenotrophomonas maltophilia TaxID=40324 RepID=UPI0021CA6548|nr:hypothetical protein [Stenotrophomonas maltophilia]MCU1197108.1 hypothetical protein [Stenotrophomonas maltophilia]